MNHIPTSFLPLNSASNPLHYIHQAQQDRHLNQRTDRRCKSLVAIRPICRDCDSDCELKVVTRSSKTLCASKPISKPESIGDPERKEEDNNKVDD